MRGAIVIVTVGMFLAITAQGAAGEEPNEIESWIAEGAARHDITYGAYARGATEQAALQDVVSRVMANRDDYAGVYWDWSAKPPSFVVRFVGKQPRDAFPDSVVTVQANNSLAELESVRDQIAAKVRADSSLSAQFVSVSVDEVANRVLVTVTDPDAAMAHWAKSFDGRVDVVTGTRATPAACNSRSDCIPFRGGIRISSSVYDCTYGFNARAADGSISMITAGHCDTTASRRWDHNHSQSSGTYIGLSNSNGLFNGHDLDVLRVRATGLNVTNPYNRVYNTSTSKSYALNAYVVQYQTYVGMPIRRVGINSSRNGEVTSGRSFYAFYWDGNLWFAWGYQSSASGVAGDSGGPVWALASGTPHGIPALAGFNSTQDGRFVSTGDTRDVFNLQYFCGDNDC